MKSPRFIVLLFIIGFALLAVALTGTDLSSQGAQAARAASSMQTWATGLAGLAVLAVGGVLLRGRYLEVRRTAPPSTPQSRMVMVVVVIVVALLLVAFVLDAVYGH